MMHRSDDDLLVVVTAQASDRASCEEPRDGWHRALPSPVPWDLLRLHGSTLVNDKPSVSPILKICRTPPVCVSPSDTVRKAARVMVKHRVGAVAVVEDHALVGILTERDLMVKVMDRDADPARLLVGETMETEVRTVRPDASRSQAAHEMIRHHCRHLPVTDASGEVLGMLSIRHLYREQLHRLRGQLDSLESYMTADGPGG